MKRLELEFSKLLSILPEKPTPGIIERIDKCMFSLDGNKVFREKPELLAFSEFSRCLSLFQKRNPGLKPIQAPDRLTGVAALINKKEEPHRDKLTDLAINIVKDLYQVPDYIDIKGIIKPRLDLENIEKPDTKPFLQLTLEQKNEMRDEIQKRIILNGLVHGSSMHIWKTIYHMVAEDLDKIDDELKGMYDYFTSLLGVLVWYIPPDVFQLSIKNNKHLTQGFNKLKFNQEDSPKIKGTIEAQAVNFPVMIHEINKGVLDWLISRAIPKNYTEEQLKYYYAIADSYENEVWHYLLSPSLWNELVSAAQVEIQEFPKIIMGLTQLSYVELADLFKDIRFNKVKAQKQLKMLLK